MAEFWIHGPIEVPCTRKRVSRIISKEDRASFWCDNDSVAMKKGCYIFAFRAGRGTKPVYVGKATKSFRQEIFTHHKLSLYHSAFADQERGAPVMFFVCLDYAKKPNRKAIRQVEIFLIGVAREANKDLLNVQHNQQTQWVIRVACSPKTQPI